VALASGTRIGPYEIKSPLGEGGMGVVYRALDIKLQREVALKLLPDHFADDRERLARFQREAQILASLNHPNIAQIHGLEDSSAQTCIVMELVDGETLQQLLERGPMPAREALPIAKQICEALEGAHEKGIIHRDLKPANIKLTPAGTVKVLDFGLAKAVEGVPTPASFSNSPTLSMAATNPGIILGTAAYMSPEQAKGRTVDKRTDIFAFGCVLFELLSGQPAFGGEDVTEIVGRVVTAEPDWNKLPIDTPTVIHRLIRRMLRKDLRYRLGDIHDARLDIEEAISEPAGKVMANDRLPRGARVSWVIAALSIALVAIAVPAVRHLWENPVPEPPERRLDIVTPSTNAPLEFALSPDGRYIVFVASGNGRQRLWVRALDKTDAEPLPLTDGADYPFWSPDSRSIGFFASGKLKRLDIAGGRPQVLTSAPASFGGAWGATGMLLFNQGSGPLTRVSAFGGTPVDATTLGSTFTHRYPTFLPDGHHFLFFGSGAPEASGIYLAPIDGGEQKRLGPANSTGFYLPEGMIVFARGTSLFVQHLDVARALLTGEPIKLADFLVGPVIGLAGVSVSLNGEIAYRSGEEGQRQLKWYDRKGKSAGSAVEPDSAIVLYPEISPDGRQVAITRNAEGQGSADVWIVDLARGGLTRLTSDPSVDIDPIWSPDGMQIAFSSNRNGPYDIYVKPSSGAGAETLVLKSSKTKYMQDWSRDGFILYCELDLDKGDRNLWAWRMSASSDQKPIAVATSNFDEQSGQFSPDGHWVAYETNEPGEFQIVVQSFPNPSRKLQVSIGGGTQPRWSADGKELYFISPEGKMMAASLNFQGSTVVAGKPEDLFPASPVTGFGVNRQQYAVSRDGRFLIIQPTAPSATRPITLILNWKPK
jgi:serine/threonine protein kinase/Tol biopolymer transport system component